MAENGKRKEAPTGGGAQERSKKKKTGNAGKWRTPHQELKAALQQDVTLQPGDTGIWISCARRQENKAAREIGVLFSEYAEKMYGIKSAHEAAVEKGGGNGGGNDEDDDNDDDDIEASIKKEVAALTRKGSGAAASAADGGSSAGQNLRPIKLNVDCLLFVKTQPPIDPVAFVRRICEDAKTLAEPGQMRCRYVNRLTPVTVMGKATEQGLVEVAKKAMGPFFDLSGKRSGAGAAGKTGPAESESQAKGDAEKKEDGNEAVGAERKAFTYAIRPSIRNHSNLKRDVVIDTIAALVNDERHKVNLTSPDKVILVEVYQTVCGMSVVDGDWDELKRYNLTELYSQARNAQESKSTS
ncbi:hypothetical protein VTK26DRAFT_1678 [Humicola hyalothermophila]